jgi:hypothetical protein
MLQGQSDFLARLCRCQFLYFVRKPDPTYSIVANAYSRGNISVAPQTAFSEVKSLFFQVLEFLLTVN